MIIFYVILYIFLGLAIIGMISALYEYITRNNLKICNGKLTSRLLSGGKATGEFENFKRIGNWEIKYPDGQIKSGPMVNGEPNGIWTVKDKKGNVSSGNVSNGKCTGIWKSQFIDGLIEEVDLTYANMEIDNSLEIDVKLSRKLGMVVIRKLENQNYKELFK